MKFFGYIADREHSLIENQINKRYTTNISEVNISEVNISSTKLFARIVIYANKQTDHFVLIENNDKIVLLDNTIPFQDVAIKRVKPTYNNDIIKCQNIENGSNIENSSIIENNSNIVNNSNFVKIKKQGEKLNFILASSRIGGARIWFTQKKNTLLFSNDLRLIISIDKFQPNILGIKSLLTIGRIIEPYTIATDIFCIPPSHYITNNGNTINYSYKMFFRFNFFNIDHSLEGIDELMKDFTEMNRKLKPDILLSGGVDSGLLAHTISSSNSNGYFLYFKEDSSELTIAETIAHSAGIRFKPQKMEKIDFKKNLFCYSHDYIQPFADYSTPSMHFLLNQAKEDKARIILDGTGGDACFGFMSSFHLKIWQTLSYCPKPFLKYFANIHSLIEGNKILGNLEYTLRPLAKSNSFPYNIASTVFYPPSSTTKITNRDLTVLNSHFNKSVRNMISTKNPSAQEFTNITHFLGSLQNFMWKNYHVGENHPVVLYPFTWKFSLDVMQQLSWNFKEHQKIVKYPLKKKLEEYISPQLIYRKKEGMIPPISDWLISSEIFPKIITFVNGLGEPWDRCINKQAIIKKLYKFQKVKRISHPFLHFIWTIIFTETWMNKHTN